MRVLAGDVGGTKTLLQIAEVQDVQVRVVYERRFENAQYSDFAPLAGAFLREADSALTDGLHGACIAVAGPVAGRRVQVTNLPWMLDADVLQAQLGLPSLRLVNDFEAVGYGVEALQADDVRVLQAGCVSARRAECDPAVSGGYDRGLPGTRAVMGAGTGLGHGVVVPGVDGYRVLPSEAGHADFAPTDELQVALWRYLAARYGRVTCERVVSGAGLVNVFLFLCHYRGLVPSAALADAMTQGDAAAAISDSAMRGRDAAAREALVLFTRIYGALAGNFALVCLPMGGLYIAGGIAPKIADMLTTGPFMEAFLDKAPMVHVLRDVPVWLVMHPNAGALGAALLAARVGGLSP